MDILGISWALKVGGWVWRNIQWNLIQGSAHFWYSLRIMATKLMLTLKGSWLLACNRWWISIVTFVQASMSRSGAKSGEGKDERSNAQKVDDKLGGMNKTAAKAMKGDLQKGGKDKPSAGSKEGDDKVSALARTLLEIVY